MNTNASFTEVLPEWLAGLLPEFQGRKAHAILLEGPAGLGQYDLALAMAAGWLCESTSGEKRPCGRCASCHLIHARTHPDLKVMLPEALMLVHDWPLDEKSQEEIDAKKRKPGREIRVESMRQTIEFSQSSSARGRGKVVVVFPAERMNAVSANALLKTLEEPLGTVRFVLASEASHLLLPTIRSRCQSLRMPWPDEQTSKVWLSHRGPGSEALLKAAGNRAGVALDMQQQGMTAQIWRLLPTAAARGQSERFETMRLSDVVVVMQKICHDLWLKSVGAPPRFFEAEDLPRSPGLQALASWAESLKSNAVTVEHPYHAPLMLQHLLTQAAAAINSGHRY